MESNYVLIVLNLISCEGELRIIGGRDALRDEYPFAVRLDVKVQQYTHNNIDLEYRQYCTGAALSSEWILTAAHCYSKKYQMVARYNSHLPKELGKINAILEFHIHPSYVDEQVLTHNDVALFRSQGISISQYGRISAVDYTNLIGHEVNILGYGGTNASEWDKPLQVLKGLVTVCRDVDLPPNYPQIKTLCVVPMCKLKATICGGDSGGPVVHPSGIIGINSRSADNCNEFTTDLHRTPGTSASILGSVNYALDWISNVISNKTSH